MVVPVTLGTAVVVPQLKEPRLSEYGSAKRCCLVARAMESLYVSKKNLLLDAACATHIHTKVERKGFRARR